MALHGFFCFVYDVYGARRKKRYPMYWISGHHGGGIQRFKRKCNEVTEGLRKRMHLKISQTGEWAALVING